MNNALFTDTPDENLDLLSSLRERESELVSIIEAIQKVAQTSDWKTLQGLIFDGQVEGLEKELHYAASRPELDTAKIYRLQGKIELAKKYSDLDKVTNTYRTELANIRKRLKS